MELLTKLISDTPKSSITESAAHILAAWSQANFDAALLGLRHLSDATNSLMNKETLFLKYLVSGSFCCEIGRLSKARDEFDAAEALQLGGDFRTAILSLKVAWLHILNYKVEKAKQGLGDLPETESIELNAHKNVTLAVIHYLEGDECQAEELLLTATMHYQKNENGAALCSIQLYQSVIQLDLGCSRLAEVHLRQAITWMAENELSYVPYWWHPQIVKKLFKNADRLHNFTQQSHQILSQQKQMAKAALAYVPSSTGRPLANSAYADGNSYRSRRNGISEKVQAEFNLLLQSGIIDKANLPVLAQKIPHGATDGQINPAILAVFGLHLQHLHNKEIAVRLQLANNTVRSYVTKIYGAFELDIRDFRTPEARRLALLENAKEEGYIN